MLRRCSALVLFAALLPLARAQGAPPNGTPAAEEAAFLPGAAKKLDAFATLCFKNGFPRKARLVWLEVVAEYDTNDEVARKELGFQRSGQVWLKDPKFDFQEQEKPDAQAAKMLEAKWDALAKELGDGHRNLGLELDKKGNTQRARYHFDRAMRFAPNDKATQAAAGAQTFENVSGSELEIAILKRSKLLAKAVGKQTETAYKTEPAAVKHGGLDQAKVAYKVVKSEHFTVYGDWDEPVLKQAAEWAERALAFCNEAFAGCEGFPPKGGMPRHLAYFTKRDTFQAILKANAGQFGSKLEFLLQNVSGCALGGGPEPLALNGYEEERTVYDHAVRCVAQWYAGVSSDGMVEGVGHAVVGMFFGRNLILSVGPEEKNRTVTSRDAQKFQLPDIDTWKQLAAELAFLQGGPSLARLPLLKVASFTAEQRIKAWSFCDYLLRRDPRLLREVDRTSAKARNEGEVREDYQKNTSTSIDDVEEGWRRYWTKDSTVHRAIENKVDSMDAVSKDAQGWLDRFNDLRKTVESPPLGWSSQLSTDCRQHADYLKQNKDQRGPDKEHTEVAGKPGASTAGRSFAETAIVWTRDRDPKKAMEQWLLLPGYRDAILNRNIDTAGAWVADGILVLDVTRGRAPKQQVESRFFPFNNANVGGVERYKDPVPPAVDVELLGAEVQALLQQNGREKQKQIGFPITAHFFHAPANADPTCTVTANGEPVKGVLVNAGAGHSRRTSAPGMWVFYPLDPLKKGVEVKAKWSYGGGSVTMTFVAG